MIFKLSNNKPRKEKAMRVLVNGIIAGLDDRKYIQDALETGRKEGVDIDFFNLVDEMEATGNKKLSMLLGTTNYLFEVLS